MSPQCLCATNSDKLSDQIYSGKGKVGIREKPGIFHIPSDYVVGSVLGSSQGG
jgi:hypothetical protein